MIARAERGTTWHARGEGACDASATPADLFPCGPYFCSATSLCDVGLGDTADRYYSCEPLPMGCDPMAPDCACLTLSGQQRCEVTQGNGVSGLTVTEVLL